MNESSKNTYELDLERAQNLDQFIGEIATIRAELWKLEDAVAKHNEDADSFDYCDARAAKYEEVDRVRYIRSLIHALSDAF